MTLPLPANRTGPAIPILWACDGIEVSVETTYPQFATAVLKVPGVDYTLWDMSAGGGGVKLFCTTTTATFTAGNPQVTVSSTTGYQAGANILAVAPNGLPFPTHVVSIDDATHLTLTNAPFNTTTAQLTLTQINVGSIGSDLSCRNLTVPTCGHILEARFNSAPTSTQGVFMAWEDPWGLVGIYDQYGGSNVFMPVDVGGYRIAFKHEALYGGDSFSPVYTEIAKYCWAIDQQPGESPTEGMIGDRLTMVRDVYPGIGQTQKNICPNYIDNSAMNVLINFNNSYAFHNGASLLTGNLNLQNINPPGTPPTNQFTIYMDSGDSKLKARGPSGTITVLGLP